MFGPLSQLPLPLVLVMHLALGWLALQVYFYIEPLSAQWAGLWAIIAGGAWVIDILNWVRLTLDRFKAREPIEKALRHVCQGVALIVLALWYLPWAWPLWLCLAVGLVRFVAGIVEVWWHPFRTMPVLMTGIRIAIGVLLYRWAMHDYALSRIKNDQYTFVIIMVPALWLLATGIARLLIVSGFFYVIFIFALSRIERVRSKLAKEPVYGSAKVVSFVEVKERMK